MLCIIPLLNDPLSHIVGLENISFRRLPLLLTPIPDKAPVYHQQ